MDKIVAQSESPSEIKSEINNVFVNVKGDISESEILDELTTKPTPGSILVFINEQISQNLGASRSYYDPYLFYNDIVHLYDFLHDRGYFNAKIDTSLVFSNDMKYVDVTISVKANNRSYIDTLKYIGFTFLEPQVYSTIVQNSIVKTGEPFLKKNAVDDQKRVLNFLHSNGYPLAKTDSVSMKRYASTNNISIEMKFDIGEEYKFGDVTYIEDHSKIDENVLSRQLDFHPGDIYSEDKRISSEQNLNRLGIFENADVRPIFSGDTITPGIAPILITYRILDMQEITPEFLVVSENNELFSTGLGIGYKHRNLLGGAQNFSVTARARVNRLQDLNFSGAFSRGLSEPTLFTKADIQMQLLFPYFFSNKTSASIILTGEAEKQPEYILNTLRAKFGLVTQLATYTSGLTDFYIERVDPKIENAKGLRIEDTTKQFNIIEAFTLQRNKTNNIFSPTEGFFHSATIEEAGFFSKAAGVFGLPYSEYYKISVVAKHFFSIEANNSRVLAFKLQGGFARLYNPKNTTPVPLPRRFFLGGSASVRAWRDKQLAAFDETVKGGNVGLEGSLESRNQIFPNGGKFLFLNIENIWSVVFFDFGNAWNELNDVNIKQVALAVGFGIRYETFVGPIRVDVAWRLYDPKASIGRQWLYEQSFFKNSYSIVHFGIGHAF